MAHVLSFLSSFFKSQWTPITLYVIHPTNASLNTTYTAESEAEYNVIVNRQFKNGHRYYKFDNGVSILYESQGTAPNTFVNDEYDVDVKGVVICVDESGNEQCADFYDSIKVAEPVIETYIIPKPANGDHTLNAASKRPLRRSSRISAKTKRSKK
jgi:hypothetical protein